MVLLSPQKSSSIQVVVRLRPMNEKEKKHGTLPVVSASTKDKTVTVIKGHGSRQARTCFSFDNVFTAFSSQEEVFEATLKPVINDVMQGYESTIFAYGQTGTGKTYTMEGHLSNQEDHGVIPRSAKAIFEFLKRPEYESHSVTCSYLEIYNEELSDLLIEDNSRSSYKKQTKLEIMNGKDGTFCRGLTEQTVESAKDVLNLMQQAQHQRKIGETKMNKQSSRSHCIFSIRIHAKKLLKEGGMLEFNGKLHLVDLAGSECAKTASLDKSSGCEATRERERMNINRSLLTLGRVITMLKTQSESKKSQNIRIPYRDSKLTRILQESLGGRCKTLIIATLSPSITAIEESTSTLNYAQSANGIVNKPVATSYLSITPSRAVLPPTNSLDKISTDNGNKTDHWHEMDCKLTYMQAQVDEAQAALARKHMQQQELVEKVELAENERMEMEKNYFSATKEIKSLKDALTKEQNEKQALTYQLQQSEITLKNTNAILKATQKTEVQLTGEAASLLETLKKSLVERDAFHMHLEEIRYSDIQRKEAARQFHSSTMNAVQGITSQLSELSKIEESYHDRIHNVTQISHEQNQKSLTKSLELVKGITHHVSKLTIKLKSQCMQENGIVLVVSSIVKETQKGMEEVDTFIKNGEDSLSNALSLSRKELEEYSSQLQRLNNENELTSNKILSDLEENFSVAKDNLVTLASSACNTLGKIRNLSSQTRVSLNKLHSGWSQSLIESSSNVESKANNQSSIISESCKSFATGMQHHNKIENELVEQLKFINEKGGLNQSNMSIQETILTNQRVTLIQAQKQQQKLQTNLIQNIMSGVHKIVKNEIAQIAKEEEQSFISFHSFNKEAVDINQKINSSVKTTFNQVEQTNSSLSKRIKVVHKNDEDMKKMAEQSNEVFSQIGQICKDQHNSLPVYECKMNNKMNQLQKQEVALDQVIQAVTKDKDHCSNHLSAQIFDKVHSGISDVRKGQTESVKYSSETFIPSAILALDKMEKPREELIKRTTSAIGHVSRVIIDGKDQIKNISQLQCKTADDLNNYVVANSESFRKSHAESRNVQINENQEQINVSAENHKKVANDVLLSSTNQTLEVKKNIRSFVTDVIKMEEGVPEIGTKNEFKYEENLSSTASSKIIIDELDFEGSEIIETAVSASNMKEDEKLTNERVSISSGENSDCLAEKIEYCLHAPSPLKERPLNRAHSEESSSSKNGFTVNSHTKAIRKRRPHSNPIKRSAKKKILTKRSDITTPSETTRKRVGPTEIYSIVAKKKRPKGKK